MKLPKKVFTLRLLMFFGTGLMFLSLLSFISFAVLFKVRKAEYENIVLMDTEFAANSQSMSMTEVLNNVLADLLYLSDAYKVYYTEHTADEIQELLGNQFLQYCRRKKIYDQIRIIDMDGREQIRVNYNAGSPTVVQRENLQDKSGRYYFTDAAVLDENSIYLSPIDLNIENGVIETPRKPMLRIGKPILVNGQKQCVIVLNFLADAFLSGTPSNYIGKYQGTQLVLNRQSYVLRNNQNHDLEFLFMFPENEQIVFRDLYPVETEAIYKSESGSLRSDAGLFIWKTITPITDMLTGEPDVRFMSNLRSGDDYFWKLVYKIDDKNLAEALRKLRRYYGRLYAVIFGPFAVFSALAAWLLNRNRDFRLQIKRMAQYDSLTGLPNRRLLTAIGDNQLALAQRQSSLAGILFLDLDGFKQVNDRHGHAAGDELLREMGVRIPAALRSSDMVFRIGGDEFVILLQSLKSSDDAGIVGGKIIAAVNQPVKIGSNTVHVGVSIGVSLYPDDDKNLEGLLKMADEAMYKAKAQGKNAVAFHHVD
jgi:diguanylate cyclase (GGDEF)-like protein